MFHIFLRKEAVSKNIGFVPNAGRCALTLKHVLGKRGEVLRVQSENFTTRAELSLMLRKSDHGPGVPDRNAAHGF